MNYIGIGECPLFKFIMKATSEGGIAVNGSSGLSDIFYSLRGIR
jgi:hypothetical protein